MRRRESVTPVARAIVRDTHLQYWVLTSSRDPAGQCQVKGLTEAVASKGYQSAQRFPQNGWETFESLAKGAWPTPADGANLKMRLSDQWY